MRDSRAHTHCIYPTTVVPRKLESFGNDIRLLKCIEYLKVEYLFFTTLFTNNKNNTIIMRYLDGEEMNLLPLSNRMNNSKWRNKSFFQLCLVLSKIFWNLESSVNGYRSNRLQFPWDDGMPKTVYLCILVEIQTHTHLNLFAFNSSLTRRISAYVFLYTLHIYVYFYQLINNTSINDCVPNELSAIIIVKRTKESQGNLIGTCSA